MTIMEILQPEAIGGFVEGDNASSYISKLNTKKPTTLPNFTWNQSQVWDALKCYFALLLGSEELFFKI